MPTPIPSSKPQPAPEPKAPKEPKLLHLLLASAGCLVVFALLSLAAFALWQFLGL